MGFISLASEVRFETTNEGGLLLHTDTGTCLDLDPLATVFLQAALASETKAHTLTALVSRVDATDEQLAEGLNSMLDQLLTLRFLTTTIASDVWTKKAKTVPFFPTDVFHSSCQVQLSSRDRVDWEFFLTGRAVNSPLPCFSFFKRTYAFWKMGNLMLFVGAAHFLTSLFDVFRRHKRAHQMRQYVWSVLSRTLSRITCHQNNMEGDLLWRLARRELVFCQILVRCLTPTGMCLVRSIAFCCYLRALGLPASVVIGRACFDLSGHYPLHAWTELAGLVVNDHTELQSGYSVIQRFPTHKEAEQ